MDSSSEPLPEKRERVGAAKGGRKCIPESEHRVRRIVLRFTEEEYAALELQAKESGRRLAVIVRSQFQARVQRQPSWTPEQFRLCRQLAALSNTLHKAAIKDGREGVTTEQVDTAKAARQVSGYLDSIIA